MTRQLVFVTGPRERRGPGAMGQSGLPGPPSVGHLESYCSLKLIVETSGAYFLMYDLSLHYIS